MQNVILRNISKRYTISHEKRVLSKVILFGWLKRKKQEALWALKGVNFEANRGEVIGIIGENGSGKTTLLKILSGVTAPSLGSVNLDGKVSPLLELGAGFHPDLTGRENIYLNGSLLGLSRQEINQKFKEIVAFSGLEEFIDAPLKNYSSGMFLRLGFSVAMHASADILLIDEVLSVGDEVFQRECINKIKEFKDSGKTIIFVSHNLDMVLNICDKVFLLQHGHILKSGNPADVVRFYLDTVGKKGVAVLQKGPLDIIFSEGRLSLYWQGRQITKGLGGFTAVFSSKRWHISTQAEWDIRSKDQNKLVVEGKWLRLPVKQTWELDVSKDGSLCWQVNTEVQQRGLCGQEQLNLMLSDGYQEWFVDNRREKFPQIQSNNIMWDDLLPEGSIAKAAGIDTDEAGEKRLPAICFAPLEDAPDNTMKVFNSDFQNNARVLQCLNSNFNNTQGSFKIQVSFGLPNISKHIETIFNNKMQEILSCEDQLNCVLEKKELKVFWNKKELPEGHPLVRSFIKGKLELMRRQAEEERLRQEEEKKEKILLRTLQNDNLRFVCWEGKMRLFWDNAEITKGIGLYSALYNAERWFLSSEIEWQVQKTKEKMLLRGEYEYLPIGQEWEIKIEPPGSFLVKVDLLVKEEINIQQGAVGLMLSDKYIKWFSGKKQGDFLRVFGRQWADILNNDYEDIVVGVAAVLESSLPQVDLYWNHKDKNNFIRASNTDFLYSARVIQLLRYEPREKSRFSPGRYPYFSFSICIKS
ncbi:MAG: ABC transporter ATP-binding protein [Candidatus Omnitrophota bacterium]